MTDCLQVVRARGISAVLQLQQADESPEVLLQADSSAVGDALDCLLHIAAASNEGLVITQESGGIMAAAQALQVSGFPVQSAPHTRKEIEKSLLLELMSVEAD